jgi:hypothetical protein
MVSWRIICILRMEAASSLDTSVLTRLTRRYIPEDGFSNVGSSTSHNVTVLHGLLRRWLYIFSLQYDKV